MQLRLLPVLSLALSFGCNEVMLQVTPPTGAVDASVPTDAGRPDTGVHPPDTGVHPPDTGVNADAGVVDGAMPDAGAVACGFDQLAPEDASRVMLVGHPFSDVVGEPGTEVSSRTLNVPYQIVEDGIRLDVGVRVSKLAFVPSGAYAFALSEDGALVSLRVNSVTDIQVVDQVSLPGGSYGEIQVLEDGQTLLVVGANGNPAAGLSTVRVGCAGELTVAEDLYFALRLTDSAALTMDGTRLWLAGGQALFDPRDDDDVRVLERLPGGGYQEVAAYDIFTDFFSADRIALSPDGSTLLVPNGLDFSSEADQLAILTLQGDSIVAMDRLTEGLGDLAEVLFSTDGQTIIASLAEPGQVVSFAKAGGSWSVNTRLRGIGLADQMAQITRGTLSDYIFLPSIDPSGPSNVAVVRVSGPGVITDLGQHDIGMGFTNIPNAIAIAP